MMVGLFLTSLFISALLLFWVQPMAAKTLLPLLGGAPMVWNTCMVFFQAVLLAGYAYAHFLTTRGSRRVQVAIHLGLLTAAAMLPFQLLPAPDRALPWQSEPVFWLLQTLFTVLALPFFALSATAPLLQRWFSHAGHRSSADPYFLYAASNFGSLLGLIGYPAFIELQFSLQEQTRLWTWLFRFLLLLLAGCAIVFWRSPTPEASPESDPSLRPEAGSAGKKMVWPQRLRWIFWAFIPSSLMLGVTTYLSTDIASVPLLWVVPLSFYLLTFILVFNRRQIMPLAWPVRLLPITAVALIFVILANSDDFPWLQIGFHLGFLFLAAMVWHSRLAQDRPSSSHLTEFYFCLSVGGVLGGVFNALVAPLLFHAVAEYPLVIVLACIRWPPKGEPLFSARQLRRSLALPLAIGFLTAGLALAAPRIGLGLQTSMLAVFGVPIILCYVLSKRPEPWPFALALGAVLLASPIYTSFYGRTVHVERNFFGTLKITTDLEKRQHRLFHGSTIHGIQFTAPDRQDEPLAYYHRSGPCGQAFRRFNAKAAGSQIAVIGLGVGSMACYAQPDQHWTFYEINPVILRIAQNTNYFTYLQRCTNALVDFKIGDARLRLREAPEGGYHLLVCDAFGSDTPPLHLLNREALALYLSKLAPDGWLLLHISSRFLDFRPVIGNLAEYFHLSALVNEDEEQPADVMDRDGKLPSVWVVLFRHSEDLDAFQSDPHWHPLLPEARMKLWTDDYSNILSIFQWQ